MFIAELFNGAPKQHTEIEPKNELVAEANAPQLVALYPGRFQPFHMGHNEVFQALQNKFGRNNVYIATSNKTDANKSPFNFSDKVQLMNAAGVPTDRILEVASPYKLPAQFDATNTVFVVVVGAPDAARLAPDTTKKDGSESYFKTFKSLAECVTADQHGYCIIAEERHKVITLLGQQVDVSHGTPSRQAWNMVRSNPQGRAEYLEQMFGRNDPELGRILDKIPAPVGESLEEGSNTKTPQGARARDPEELDSLITSIGQKAKQGEMKTVWVPDQYGKGGRYRVVPVSTAPVEEDAAPMSREEYMTRRKSLQQIQMDPKVTQDPILRKELIKKIAQLTMQARSAGVLPESVYAAHVQENLLFEAKAIVNTIKYLKESTSTALKFSTKDLKESEVRAYIKNYYQAHEIDRFPQKLANDVLSPKSLKESAESDIKGFIDQIESLGLPIGHKISVGSKLAVLNFEINFGWKEITVDGSTAPREITKIKTNQDGTINYVMFADGDRYPRQSPARYSGKPLIYATYFDTRNSAEQALTVISLRVPDDWDFNQEPQ